jgi:hypothetical protein
MKITPVERLDQVLAIALRRAPSPLTPEQREEDERRLAEMRPENPPQADPPGSVGSVSAV